MNKQDELTQAEAHLSALKSQHINGDEGQRKELEIEISNEEKNIDHNGRKNH